MGDYFLGEIRAFGFDWAPQGWALANGATIQIRQASALYALIGLSFGGDGVNTFQLPDLRGRTPISWGHPHAAVSGYSIGNKAGAETVAVTTATLPPHNHLVLSSTDMGQKPLPEGDDLAANAGDATIPPLAPNIYGPPTPLVPLHPTMITNTGGGSAHGNMQPFTVLNYCIAIVGLWPSRP